MFCPECGNEMQSRAEVPHADKVSVWWECDNGCVWEVQKTENPNEPVYVSMHKETLTIDDLFDIWSVERICND